MVELQLMVTPWWPSVVGRRPSAVGRCSKDVQPSHFVEVAVLGLSAHPSSLYEQAKNEVVLTSA